MMDTPLQVWTEGNRSRIVVPATLDAAEAAVGLLRERWTRLGLSKETLFKLGLVLREALINAVTHGSAGDPSKRVSVHTLTGSGGATITVSDQGPGFDWRARLPDCDTPPDPTCATGRGLCIMRLYATSMRYNEPGNALTLTVSWQEESPMKNSAVASGPSVVAANAQVFKDKCLEALSTDPASLTVDCRELEQIDSVGIGVLIQAHNSASRSGGALTLVDVSDDILSLLRAMRLDKHFHINP
ncbi:ATP-binding protein [Fundidesulfovibrio butyratiphilus]